MYTLESLIAYNPIVDPREITQDDVDDVNRFISLIENSRGSGGPVIGDIVQYTSKDGDYFSRAFYENEQDSLGNFCLGGALPYIFESKDNPIGFSFITSGGPWGNIDTKRFELAGKQLQGFKAQTHGYLHPRGAVMFEAQVDVWRFTEPDQRYGTFSTETWSKSYVHVKEQFGDRKPNYLMHETAVIPVEEYAAWVKTYIATEFHEDTNKIVVFHYRDEDHLLGYEEWDDLPYAYDTRIINASIMLVKVRYDHDKHVIRCYRFSNGPVFQADRLLPYEQVRNTTDLGKFWNNTHRTITREAIHHSLATGDYDAGRSVIKEWAKSRRVKGIAVNEGLVNRIFEEWVTEQDFIKQFGSFGEPAPDNKNNGEET